ncbi:MAG: hypothetical protein RLZZ200_687, partial [Pseudomonadota bacterium]
MSRQIPSFAASFLAVGVAAAALPAHAAADAATQRALGQISRFPTRTLAGADDRFAARDVVVDADGTEHVRLDRWHKGLRVIGGDLVVHSNNGGTLRGVSKTLDRQILVDGPVALGAPAAMSAALATHAGLAATGAAEEVVYARGVAPERAYEVSLGGQRTDGTPIELHVVVSRVDGRILDRWDGIETVATNTTGTGFLSGAVALTTDSVTKSTTVKGKTTTTTSWLLRDPSRGSQYAVNMANSTTGGAVFSSATNLWGNGSLSNVETVAVDAQYGAARTWDYFKATFG